MSTDVRALTREAQEHVRRRLLRRTLPGTVMFLLLAAALLPLGVREGDPAMGIVGGLFLATAVPVVVASALRHREGAPRVHEGSVDGSPATVIRKPAGAFWAGLATLGAIALFPAAAAAGLAAEGHGLGATVAAAVALALTAPLLAAIAGRYLAGEITLTDHGLRYRHLGLESTVTWADMVHVRVDEPTAEVRISPSHPTRVRHRFRAGPVRGQRPEPGGSLVLQLRDWGVLATDVGRLVLHYAATPADRAELGTRAVRERLGRLSAIPVQRRHNTWLVGDDSGTRTFPFDEQDVAAPVWVDTTNDRTTSALLESYRHRALFGGGLLGVGLVVTALALMPGPLGAVAAVGLAAAGVASLILVFATPKRPELAPAEGPGPVGRLDGVVLRRAPLRHRLVATACGGSGLALGAVVLHTAGTWPWLVTLVAGASAVALLTPVALLVTGRSAAGELVLDEAGVAYRSGRAAWTVGWTELARVDAMWDGVVRLERHDGTTLRLDVTGMPEHPYPLVELLAAYVHQGGPRGDTRSVETVRRRLRDGV